MPAGTGDAPADSSFAAALAAFRAFARPVHEPLRSRTERALWADLRGETRRTQCVQYLEDHDLHLPAVRA